MKIRTGFVSNSSSSSFLIVGRHVERKDLDGLKARAKELRLGDTFDNTSYDPAEWCEECENGKKVFPEGVEPECYCHEYRIFFGFGESGDEYGMNELSTSKFNEYLMKAEKLFGEDNVQVFFGRQGNE